METCYCTCSRLENISVHIWPTLIQRKAKEMKVTTAEMSSSEMSKMVFGNTKILEVFESIQAWFLSPGLA